MSISKQPMLPPKPIKGNLNKKPMEGVNSFPEAKFAALKYAEIPRLNSTTDTDELVKTHNSVKPLYFTDPKYGYGTQEKVKPPVWVTDKTSNNSSVKGKIFVLLGLSLISVLLLVLILFTSFSVGISGALLSMVLACVPFAVIFLCISWLDKWNSKPFNLKLASFLWGGGVSVGLTFLITFGYNAIFGSPTDLFGSAAIQAPFVEEFAKGLGVILLAVLFRKHFRGPVDGIVYMAVVAAGFAFTENILYFSESIAQNGLAGVVSTFFLRGILSPFAHVVFSIPMGILIGIALKRGYKIWGILGFAFIGYAPAVLLHALWNGSSTLIDGDLWFVFYGVIQIPIFAGAFFAAIWFRRAEAFVTYRRLTEYGWAGWFTPIEVESFGTWKGRKQAMRWAKRRSLQANDIMKEIAKDVVALSSVRENIITKGINTDVVLSEEQELLNRITENKNFLLTL
jgi:RsiW-degrading membrane proteinase PrsW (M82 family)